MNELSYRYYAATIDGRLQRGRVVAQSHEAAVTQLAGRGLHPIELTRDASRVARRPALPIAELALALRLLADLLDAGLPLARALQTLETLVSPKVAPILPPLLSMVREGCGLARALEQLDVSVPGDVLGVIRAGERGSALSAAVRQAAELTEDAARTRAAVRSALAYPILLAVAGTASLGLLVGIVLPRFATILTDLGQTLPPTTRLVLGAGAVARVAAIPTLLAGVVLIAAGRAWIATNEGRRRWDAFLLTLPMIGETRATAATARFSASLSALLATGVPMAAAMRSAATSTGDAELTARILAARADVEHGSRLSDALGRRAAITAIAQRLARAGEESGRLASMLAHASRLERERVLRRVQAAVRLIEPTLIVTLGAVIALVAAALLQALYSVRPGA